MLTDLFSHKIHSSSPDWPEKLIELAFIFLRFDGQIFQRDAIEETLRSISPRSSIAARDPSKFRDEISAYPAYLGLYHLEASPQGWILRVSETAKKFLVTEEPDVASFLILQLALFQFPNGSGLAYSSTDASARIQSNARDKTLGFISEGVHLSPLRFVIQLLFADSELRGVDIFDSQISYEEIFAVANYAPAASSAHVDRNILKEALTMARSEKINAPDSFERRFHILEHTQLLVAERGGISPRKPESEADAEELFEKLQLLANIEIQFTGFDLCRDGNQIVETVTSGAWAKYFDAVKSLSAETVEVLSRDIIARVPIPVRERAALVGRKIDTKPRATSQREPIIETTATVYSFRARTTNLEPQARVTRARELADPEVTRIKRQRRNLEHKILLDKLDTLLRRLGSTPQENPHIDLLAKIPDDGSFLFEVKSGGENLLDQIRKGISQLYEYRFRYSGELPKDIKLCLVLPDEPIQLPWVLEYLILDRQICVCWFNAAGEIKYPPLCERDLEPLAA